MALTQSLSGQITINNTIAVWDDNNNLPSGYDDGIILTNNAELTLENIVIYDMLGKVVYQDSPNTSHIEVDMNAFTKGVYFILLSDNNNIRYSSKLIKE